MKNNIHIKLIIFIVIIHESFELLTESSRQMPQPDLSALKDDTGETQLSDEFLPAVMMALHYYTDMMQYEQVQNSIITQKPSTVKTSTTTTSKRTTTTRKTTWMSTTTQRIPTTTKIKPQYQQQHKPHKPGVYSPEKPIYFTYFNYNMKPEQNFYHKPGVQQQQLQHGITTLAEPDWKDKDFLNWFFQSKPKEIESLDENTLQYLDILPKTLLMDIYRDYQRRPALLDFDNVIEFRKIFDDSYRFKYGIQEPTNEQMMHNMRIQVQQQRPMVIFKKKVPPTRPYVLMLMLYDLLKREAKTKKLHQFEGFSEKMLQNLDENSHFNGVHQMTYLLEGMLEGKEITTPDIIARTNVIIKDLKNERSDTYKTLNNIPPLLFTP